MKLICTQENLKSGLGIATRIISSTNTLPILNNLLLKTENGQLKISSTNLELAVNTHVRGKIEEDGQTTVLAKTFSELINNLPNENITLITTGSGLLIKTENQEFKIKTLPAEEFPFIPEVPNQTAVEIDGEVLKTAINQVVFAASANQTQPEIAGILFDFKDGKLRLAATDRYRLAEKTLEAGGSVEMIAPQKCTLEISRVLGMGSEKVGVVVSENQAFFSIGQTQIISRLVEGQYPDYRSIIPENFAVSMMVDKHKLYSALKANALFSQNSSSVKLDYSSEKQKLTISSESQDLGSGVVDIPSTVDGGTGSLLLNYRYVLDFLSQAPEGNVVIKVVNESSPAMFGIEKHPDYVYLVMPIKV